MADESYQLPGLRDQPDFETSEDEVEDDAVVEDLLDDPQEDTDRLYGPSGDQRTLLRFLQPSKKRNVKRYKF